MKLQTSFRILGLLMATLLAVACGGGGYGGSSIAGIDRTGLPNFALAFGTISGFGSVIVNGVHYDTSTSSFTIDGQPGSQDDLRVGDVVLVQGTLPANSTNGTATSVIYDDSVEGPISFIDGDTSTLIVLGQTVQISADTSFDDRISPASIDGLSVNDVIEVSGFVSATGSIAATRIEPKAASTGFEVTGLVSAHNAGAMTFMINGLTIDYGSQTVLLDNFPGGVITDGDLVEVKGSTSLGAGGELIATRVEFKANRFGGGANYHLEVEGLITRFASQTDFDVSGVTVTTNGSTTFQGDVNNLGLNVKVEVEGALDSSGTTLVASRVDIRRARIVRIEATVDSVDASANTFVALGVAIQVDALTRIEDKFANPPVQPFTLANLNPGNFVRMRGSELTTVGATANVLAALLERDDPRDTELQGLVDAGSIDATARTFSILGVTIDASSASTFRNVDGSSLTAGAFFALLQDGSLARANGSETAPTTIVANEVQLELEQ
jgi:hypothetical protein